MVNSADTNTPTERSIPTLITALETSTKLSTAGYNAPSTASLPRVGQLSCEALFDVFIATLKKSTTQKGKALFMPLRVAVTGHVHGPELKKVFEILGRKSIEGRFERASQFLKQ